MGQAHEREQIRAEEARRQYQAQEARIQQIVADTKKSYEDVKALFAPEPWKALLSLRAKIRRIRKSWLHKQVDAKVPHEEKDVLAGQYNAALIAFDILDQIKELNEKMEPGKEADYIREKIFKNPQAQQQR